MKPLILPAVAALAMVMVSCGSSGSSTPPPPPATGNFTNASLQGTYSFSMSGADASANPGAFLARVGSFIADGKGNITAGMEDLTDAGSNQTVQFTGGTYAIQPNGKGTITLNTLAGGLGLTVVLNSASKGVLIQTDLNATSSGTLVQQTASAFTTTAISGGYAFDCLGRTPRAHRFPWWGRWQRMAAARLPGESTIRMTEARYWRRRLSGQEGVIRSIPPMAPPLGAGQ